MTIPYGSHSYRVTALALAQALERLHGRLDHSGNDESQPKRKSTTMQRRPAPAKRRSRKEVKA